jgi:hypothetical protein
VADTHHWTASIYHHISLDAFGFGSPLAVSFAIDQRLSPLTTTRQAPGVSASFWYMKRIVDDFILILGTKKGTFSFSYETQFMVDFIWLNDELVLLQLPRN